MTATENAIMAAALAEGETIICNAAGEPHVQDLCRFLIKLGAQIDGIATNSLRVTAWRRCTAATYHQQRSHRGRRASSAWRR